MKLYCAGENQDKLEQLPLNFLGLTVTRVNSIDANKSY